MELGIYGHFPFCKSKCYYCDFISYANKMDMQEKYIEKLKEEIAQNKEILQKNKITTIYFGGGTPSVLKPELIEQVLNQIYKVANIQDKERENIEITIEVNPGTVTKNNLQLYKSCGFNRISIGLQSTQDRLLKEIGRIHNFSQFKSTYTWAREVGFENINVDLMLGLPNQTLQDLKDSLEMVTNLDKEIDGTKVPEHISVYSLIVEEGTKIEEMLQTGKLKLPDDEDERNQYHYMKNYLELKGYKHYEISNFARTGFESKHNTNCWEQKQYIGFGVAAHSYINGIRYSNTSDLDKYLNSTEKEVRTIEETQNKIDMEKEYMLLGLRKIDGISISKFEEKFAENPIYLFRMELQKLVEAELLEVDLDTIRLTNKGLDFANLVWEEFV